MQLKCYERVSTETKPLNEQFQPHLFLALSTQFKRREFIAQQVTHDTPRAKNEKVKNNSTAQFSQSSSQAWRLEGLQALPFVSSFGFQNFLPFVLLRCLACDLPCVPLFDHVAQERKIYMYNRDTLTMSVGLNSDIKKTKHMCRSASDCR